MKMSEFRPGRYMSVEGTDQLYLGLYIEGSDAICLGEGGTVVPIPLEDIVEEYKGCVPIEFPEDFPRKSLLSGNSSTAVEDIWDDYADWQFWECRTSKACLAKKNLADVISQEESFCENCIFHPDQLSEFKDLEEEARKL